ncbi:hypothetical protein [Sphingomonas pruni]|uniref:hypothetical protein n=1 Tax=Sphingomonas pruni TaxID=40683 RepID=UPI000B0CBAC9|nr:hypothetical protein [Sphingomonas pruni]
MILHRHWSIPALLAAAMSVTLPGNAAAQKDSSLAPGVTPPAPSATPMPATIDIDRMVWTTMVTVQGAIASGNYSVLRDNAAPAFQAANDTTRLTAIFTRLRADRIDLTRTLLVTPVFRAPPRLIRPGLLQVQGSFPLRPTALDFEMLYQWTEGEWRMFGVAISTGRLPTASGAAPSAAPQPTSR